MTETMEITTRFLRRIKKDMRAIGRMMEHREGNSRGSSASRNTSA